MKRMMLLGLLTAVTLTFIPQTSHAQIKKLAGKALQYVGKVVTTAFVEEAVGRAVDYGYNQYFGEQQSSGSSRSYRNVNVRIINDYPFPLSFWATNDGVNWYPQGIYSGYYLDFSSGSSGAIAVFDGHRVITLDRSGTYYASGM